MVTSSCVFRICEPLSTFALCVFIVLPNCYFLTRYISVPTSASVSPEGSQAHGAGTWLSAFRRPRRLCPLTQTSASCEEEASGKHMDYMASMAH